MEMIENLMCLEEIECKSNYIEDDIWAEKEDLAYEDEIFEEMEKR